MISTVETHSAMQSVPSAAELEPRQIQVQVSASRCACGRTHGDAPDGGEDKSAFICGTIVGLGSQTSPWIAAKRVLGVPVIPRRCGETLAVLNFDQAHLLSPNVSDETALALTDPIVSAWFALTKLAGLRKGEKVLVTNPTDPVSAAVIQIAEVLGAQSISAALDSDAVEIARKLGVHRIISCNSPAADCADEALHGQIDVIVDSSSEDGQELIAAFCAPGGRLIAVQNTIEVSVRNSLMTIAASKGMAVFPVSTKLMTNEHLREVRHQAVSDLLQVIAKDRCPAFSARMHAEAASADC